MSAEKKRTGLGKDDLATFKEALLERLRVISGTVERLEDQTQRSASDEVSVDHMADHGSDSFETDQTIGLIEREGESIRAIQKALKMIEDGTYGVCEACSELIKKPRLRALPYALLCLNCQMEAEGS